MAVLGIIQARMGSTRLPGKVLMPLSGKPVLWHVIDRVSKASRINMAVVATTVCPEDDIIQRSCNEWGFRCMRGDSQDVLKRFFAVVSALGSEGSTFDYIVRITADCPLIDPELIDKIIGNAEETSCDYVSNTDPPTYPDGLDVEVFTPHALDIAHHNAFLPSEREHVTPFMRTNPVFKKMNITYPEDFSHLRWTLDTPSDYEFIHLVYQYLYSEGKVFSMADVLTLLKEKPSLCTLNAMYQRNEGYKKSLNNDTMNNGVKIR